MIGAPTLDPRQGERRRKALESALRQAAQRRVGMSRFSRTGIGRGSVAGFGRRPVSVGGRPSGILSFLTNKAPSGFPRGLAAYRGPSGGLGRLVAATQLPSAPLPQPDLGVSPGGTPYSPPGTGGLQPPVDPGDTTSEDSSFEGETGVSDPFSIPSSGEILIPLGGGIFIDPISGNLSGPRLNVTGLQEGI